jgi:hypothetical protein
VDGGDACFAEKGDDFSGGGSPYEAIVDEDDSFSFDGVDIGAVFESDSEAAYVGGGFDEGASDVVVADDSEVEGYIEFSGEADGGGIPRVGNGHDEVCFDSMFDGEFFSDLASGGIDGSSVEGAVWAGEVDIFEEARSCIGLTVFHDDAVNLAFLLLVLGDEDDFPSFDFSDEVGPDHVEGASFGSEDV